MESGWGKQSPIESMFVKDLVLKVNLEQEQRQRMGFPPAGSKDPVIRSMHLRAKSRIVRNPQKNKLGRGGVQTGEIWVGF